MQDDSRAGNIIPPPPLAGADYDAIFATMAATERGRWFLDEYAMRHRGADTDLVLAALGRIEAEMRGSVSDPSAPRDGAPRDNGPRDNGARLPDSVRQDFKAASDAISRARQAIGYADTGPAATLRQLIDEIDWRLHSLADSLHLDHDTSHASSPLSVAESPRTDDDLTLAMTAPQPVAEPPDAEAAGQVAIADWGFASSEAVSASAATARLPTADLDSPTMPDWALPNAVAVPDEPPAPPPRPAFDWVAAAKSSAPEPAIEPRRPDPPLAVERVVEPTIAAIERLEAREYGRTDDLWQSPPAQDDLPPSPHDDLWQTPPVHEEFPQSSGAQDDLWQAPVRQDEGSSHAIAAADDFLHAPPTSEQDRPPPPEPPSPRFDDVIGQPERLDLLPIRAALDELVMAEPVAAGAQSAEIFEEEFRPAFEREIRPEPAPLGSAGDPATMDMLISDGSLDAPSRADGSGADTLFDTELFDAGHIVASPAEPHVVDNLQAPAHSLPDLVDAPAADTSAQSAATDNDSEFGGLTERVAPHPFQTVPTPRMPAAATLTSPVAAPSPTVSAVSSSPMPASPAPAAAAAPTPNKPLPASEKAEVLDRLEHMRKSIASLMDEIAQKTGRPIVPPKP